jgi:(2Fe-2S) ferredoxin
MNLKNHLFICTYNRETGESCGAKGANGMVDELKKWIKENKKTDVKVTRSGCLGLCEKGIAAVCYPRAQWFEGLTPNDVESLKKDLI